LQGYSNIATAIVYVPKSHHFSYTPALYIAGVSRDTPALYIAGEFTRSKI
jgi:hypothetical protein